jgi:hypothetical protein
MIAVFYIYYFYFLDSQKFLPVVPFQRNETTMEFFMSALQKQSRPTTALRFFREELQRSKKRKG